MEVQFVEFDKQFFYLTQIWLSNPELLELIDANPIDYNTSLKWFEGLNERNDYLIWGINYDNNSIGVAGLKNIKDTNAEYFGYIGESKFWGLGLGQSILNKIISIAKEKGFKEVWLKVNEQNTRAIKSYIKFGFVKTNSHNSNFYMRFVL